MPNAMDRPFLKHFHARVRGVFPSFEADEDAGRKRLLLYAVLGVSLALSAVCFLLTVVVELRRGEGYQGVPSWTTGAVFAFFAALLYLTSRNRLGLASIGIFIAYLVPSIYASARWGVDLPQALLLDAFLIVMASVLLGTRSALLLSAGLSAMLLALSWMGTHSILSPNSYWRLEPFTFWDGVAISMTLLCVALLCRLANRELERSLERARTSEKLLRAERDLLEVRIEERTRDLKKAQMEKMNQAHRFIEFGKLASGFFHDLASPLTALTLNLELMRGEDAQTSKNARVYLQRAMSVAGRLESFLKDVQRHAKPDGLHDAFRADEVLDSVFAIMESRARKAGVALRQECPEGLALFGNAVGFYKILSNLVSNAIDSYQGAAGTLPRTVEVRIAEEGDAVKIEVADHGCGMSEELLKNIWKPFYTTKSSGPNMGMGLSIVKTIVEDDFGGTVSCTSGESLGTTFKVHLPRHEGTAEHPGPTDRRAD